MDVNGTRVLRGSLALQKDDHSTEWQRFAVQCLHVKSFVVLLN